MRKLLTFLIALGAGAFGVCSPASAGACLSWGLGLRIGLRARPRPPNYLFNQI